MTNQTTTFLLITPDSPMPLEACTFIAVLDGRNARTLSDFYKEIARILTFPDYFHHNLDSLEEMIRDLSWIAASRIMLYIRYTASFLAEEQDKRPVVFSIFHDTLEEWQYGEPDDPFRKEAEFYICLDDDDVSRELLAVGGYAYESYA
ncbi:barstar family protein [Chitinophaga pendula]|uniref:barstar family protein n=1 Tax=Chitinophaga TaxID=79328 RepID=UPI000BAF43E2|nr:MULTISPECIES: barstar family protein [Chitinophaga]ASZ13224.1 barnase inhibitor [Chitinophaga sp. MD30]UCJ09157.1 barstar family protein [Chitinophaga pendula]